MSARGARAGAIEEKTQVSTVHREREKRTTNRIVAFLGYFFIFYIYKPLAAVFGLPDILLFPHSTGASSLRHAHISYHIRFCVLDTCTFLYGFTPKIDAQDACTHSLTLHACAYVCTAPPRGGTAHARATRALQPSEPTARRGDGARVRCVGRRGCGCGCP